MRKKAQFETIKNFILEFVKCCSHQNAFLEVQNFMTENNDKNYYHTFILSDGNCLLRNKFGALKKNLDNMDYKIKFNYFED